VNFVLVGAGGHAKAVYEAITAAGDAVVAYADPRPAAWLSAHHLEDDASAPRFDPAAAAAIGIGGATPTALAARLAVLDGYLEVGRPEHAVVHASAWVSETAELGPGVIVLAGAVVQPSARLARGAIVNTRAVVEHDSAVGAGSHVAPGAIVLGGCTVGERVMIGAGAVVLPGSVVADDTLIPAASRFPG
jgi:sugar O-acyltransferase (sialic acid O-acetyltransferase NeuD family)